MRRMLSALVVFFLMWIACSAHAPKPANPIPPFLSIPIQQERDSTYRVMTICMDERWGMGSGVAVSEEQLITARHVADWCETHSSTLQLFAIIGTDGLARQGTLVAHAQSGTDVSLLNVYPPMPTHLPVRVTPPSPGEKFCMIGGDLSILRIVRRCGVARFFTPEWVGLSIPAVGGNSGGPLLDRDSHVAGVVRGWVKIGNEFFMLMIPVSLWADLLVSPRPTEPVELTPSLPLPTMPLTGTDAGSPDADLDAGIPDADVGDGGCTMDSCPPLGLP